MKPSASPQSFVTSSFFPSLPPTLPLTDPPSEYPTNLRSVLCGDELEDVDHDGIEDCVDEDISVDGLSTLSKFTYDEEEMKIIGTVTIPSVWALSEGCFVAFNCEDFHIKGYR